MESNAQRFIKAYNRIDNAMRTQYNLKRGMSFVDCIRRVVMLNSVVRKFEDELIDYGRLRNAIIHSSQNDMIIAEPHLDVVEKFEYIAAMVATPPRVLESICRKDVLCVEFNTSVKKTIELIFRSGYSNLPVYKDGMLVGVANGQKIVNEIGKRSLSGENIDEFLENTTIESVCQIGEKETFYSIQNSDLTLSEALNLFYSNRKLLVILLTQNGTFLEPPLGVLTVGDIVDINKVLENYK